MSAGNMTSRTLQTSKAASSSIALSIASLLSEEPPSKRRRLEPDISRLSTPPQLAQQSYSHTTAQGNARVHYGNTTYHGPVYLQHDVASSSMDHHTSQPCDSQISADALKFDTMDDRYYTIEPTHSGTCRWLFEREEYQNWRHPAKLHLHNGFLWIKGKPGSGKSTLTKFACQQDQIGQEGGTVIAYYFNARGNDILQKCLEGMYRSLLYQIYSRLPNLLRVLQLHANHGQMEWSLGRLKSIFRETILALESDRLTCYIDALDECAEESEVRDLVRFFEALGESAVSAKVKFNVLFSSRHYPHITIGKCQHLYLDDDSGHESDINHYIRSHLRIGSSKLALEIQQEVQRKASGVFLWVVLVTRILNDETDRGNIHQLRDRLRAIPGDLHALFDDLVQKTKAHERASLTLVLQLALFSPRYLTWEDLYFAIVSNSNDKDIEAWNPDEVTLDDMSKCILNISKGLLETTSSKAGSQGTIKVLRISPSTKTVETLQRPVVQFIHESVRDYLFEGGMHSLISQLGHHAHESRDRLEALCHDQLKQCCNHYVTRTTNLLLRMKRGELKEDVSTVNTFGAHSSEKALISYPFLRYALQGILYHADLALSGGIVQEDYVDDFPVYLWSKLYNFLRPADHAALSPLVSRLYLFVMEGALHLAEAEIVRLGPPNVWDYNILSEQHPTLLSVAVHRSDLRMVELLLRKGADANSCAKDSLNCLCAAIYSCYDVRDHSANNFSRNLDITKLLLEYGADVNAERAGQHNALTLACKVGNVPMLKDLIAHGANVNVGGGSPLREACNEGHVDSVKILLEHGADINLRNDNETHATALQSACLGNYADIVKLLLREGADVNHLGGTNGPALVIACLTGRLSIVRILLEHNADVSLKGGFARRPLQIARSYGRFDIEELLLKFSNGDKLGAKSTNIVRQETC